MRRVICNALVIAMILAMLVFAVGCVVMSPEAGAEELKAAYENTRDNYNDIYQYSEKIYRKATPEKNGSIDNTIVNVNCAVDKHYNLIKDKDYAIRMSHDRYIETMDETMKATNKFVGSNEIIVGETKAAGAKTDGLFVSTSTLVQQNGKEKLEYAKYVQQDIKARDFYDSAFFVPCQLMNMQVMRELGALTLDDMDYDIAKGGIEKKGRTTDYKFAVKRDYLDAYEAEHGVPSVFDGDYVWVQTSYGRISNIYVYNEEKLGAGLVAEYESYIFMITYLGKRVEVPASIPSLDDQSADGYSGYKSTDILSEGNIRDGILSPLDIIVR